MCELARKASMSAMVRRSPIAGTSLAERPCFASKLSGFETSASRWHSTPSQWQRTAPAPARSSSVLAPSHSSTDPTSIVSIERLPTAST